MAVSELVSWKKSVIWARGFRASVPAIQHGTEHHAPHYYGTHDRGCGDHNHASGRRVRPTADQISRYGRPAARNHRRDPKSYMGLPSKLISAATFSSAHAGCRSQRRVPMSPYSSPVDARKRIERRGQTFSPANRAATASSFPTPKALSAEAVRLIQGINHFM